MVLKPEILSIHLDYPLLFKCRLQGDSLGLVILLSVSLSFLAFFRPWKSGRLGARLTSSPGSATFPLRSSQRDALHQ